MRLSDFDYHLPEELIAQEPPAERDGARMLVLHRDSQRLEDRRFREFPQFLHPGDCLALNQSGVLASRLFGHRLSGGGAVEILLLEPASERSEWKALVRPGRKLGIGERVHFDDDFSAEIIARGERGERVVKLRSTDIDAAIERTGHMPLPPYIKREDNTADRERYQTVFARDRGSAAAPTAGLHFTEDTLRRCQAAGASVAKVTLHVGLGTFQSIEREDFEDHQLHFERYSISPDAWSQIRSAQRVVAVGTTSVRTIESAARQGETSGNTNLFIYPGYQFRRVGAMLTNFHLPRTSLLLLVCAFAGPELAMSAYRHAVEARYRFFSYGDCMLIL